MVLEALITIVAAATVLELLIDVITDFLGLWGSQELPQNARAELSNADQEKVKATQRLITECFGEDMVGRIKDASNKDRIILMTDFAERLAKEYGLDIEVDVTVGSFENCGCYNWKERKAVFNIALLMVDGSQKNFDHYARESVDTIIHELRHAVQHKAINEPGFWDIGEERRVAWANNMSSGNYIPASVDVRAYVNQPIEKDAFTFAATVMEGVH